MDIVWLYKINTQVAFGLEDYCFLPIVLVALNLNWVFVWITMDALLWLQPEVPEVL